MAKPPVTRLQLDAYRFGQRRLESALALRDPVLLHEQMRTQRRTVAVGLVLATLIGAIMVGYVKFTHRDAWQAQTIIVSNQTNQMYVVIHRPDRLVPVRNLAAARLVLKAAGDPKSGLAGLVGPSDPARFTPVRLDQAALAGASLTAPSALSGAPDTNLPGADTPLAPAAPWALCATGGGRTMLIQGPTDTTRPLGPGEGLVLTDGRDNYLVTGEHRYLIGAGGAAAYDLKDALVGAPSVPASLLALIPPVRLGTGHNVELAALPLEVSTPGSTSRTVQVVRVERPGQDERNYLVTAGRAVLLSAPLAKLIRAGLGQDVSQPAPMITVDQINAYTPLALPWVNQYPSYQPVIQRGPDTAVLCWQWDADGRNPRLRVAATPPVPATQPVTTLAQADGPGAQLDQVSLPSGAVIATSAVAGADAGLNGPLGYWLVSSTGVGYPIKDADTARALGIEAPISAPVDALDALPRGSELSLAEAGRTVDVYRENPATGAG
jgi:hypothetical protein